MATIVGSTCVGAEVGSAVDSCRCCKALEECAEALEEGPTTAWEAPKGNGCKAESLTDGQGPYGSEFCAIAKAGKLLKQQGNSPGEQRLITCMNRQTASNQVEFDRCFQGSSRITL